MSLRDAGLVPGTLRAWVGLGGNVGDVAATFESALGLLRGVPGVRLMGRSRLYRTKAWGRTDQPDFINAVAELAVAVEPVVLLGELQRIEQAHGRDRATEIRWGPRTLDLDLLAVGDRALDTAALQLPHPRAMERAFVLVPWLELAPDLVLPGIGALSARLATLDRSGVEAIP